MTLSWTEQKIASELRNQSGGQGWDRTGDLPLFRLTFGKPRDYWERLLTPIGEAIQLLEHAELVYIPPDNPSQGRPIKWSATRFGLATMANGKTAVRQRIKDRPGL